MSAGKWIEDVGGLAFSWKAPSGRVYRVSAEFGGVVRATCDTVPLRADYAPKGVTPRERWWRSFHPAMTACESVEARGGETVQTSAPAAPASADKSQDLTPLGHALFSSRVSGLIQMGNTEQVEFRVDQALGALKRGVVDEVIAWLDEATTAARVMKKAQRDATLAEAGAKP